MFCMMAQTRLLDVYKRQVLHTALRRPASEKGQLIVDGQDVVADVHEVLDRMYAFAERVRSGEDVYKRQASRQERRTGCRDACRSHRRSVRRSYHERNQ